MGIVLVTLILGLAIAIERIIYLNMATTNTDKLVNNVEEATPSTEKYPEVTPQGTVTFNSVAETNWIFAEGIETVPKVTTEVAVKPVPEMVTTVPAWPVVGVIGSTVANFILTFSIEIEWFESILFEKKVLVINKNVATNVTLIVFNIFIMRDLWYFSKYITKQKYINIC